MKTIIDKITNSIIIRKAQKQDYPAIIQLQNANTPDQLTDKEKEQGFVVSSMTEETLHAINENLGVLVAIENNFLAGFVCLATTNPSPEHPIVKAMFNTFPQQKFNHTPLKDYRVFIYGPVLINAKFRGKGILKSLFNAVVDYTKKDFDIGTAFINDKNTHSLAVHIEGLDMTCLQPFEAGNERISDCYF